MSLTVEVTSGPLMTILDRLYQTATDMSPIMSAAGMEMESRISGRFESQTDPLGGKWLPWKESTVKSYPKGGNKRLLDCIGDMLDSLNHSFDDRSATVGFGDPKAAHHEWGTEHMERRGMIFADPEVGTLSPDDERALQNVVEMLLNRQAGSF